MPWVPPHPAPCPLYSRAGKQSFLKAGKERECWVQLCSQHFREKLVNQKQALVDTGQTQGTGWVTMAPRVGTERQWFTMGGGGSAMPPPQHASLLTRSEGWGSSAPVGWGQGTHHPGSTCPPAPSTPHQGRGPASPVTAAALRNPTLWIGGAQPDCPCPGPQPQAEATGRGACLTRSPGVPLGPGGPSCPFRPWGADGRRAGGVAQEGCAPLGERASHGPFSD